MTGPGRDGPDVRSLAIAVGLSAVGFTGIALVLPGRAAAWMWAAVEDATQRLVVPALAVWSEEMAALADADEENPA